MIKTEDTVVLKLYHKLFQKVALFCWLTPYQSERFTCPGAYNSTVYITQLPVVMILYGFWQFRCIMSAPYGNAFSLAKICFLCMKYENLSRTLGAKNGATLVRIILGKE